VLEYSPVSETDPVIPPIEPEEPTSRVFDLTDPATRPETLRLLMSEPLNPEDKVVGMKTWAELSEVIDIFVARIATTSDPTPETRYKLKNPVDIKRAFATRDREKGFYGTSGQFEITMLPTDISFVRRKRVQPIDESLARTFGLSRRIFSTALPREGKLVLSACTISLADAGTVSKPFYRDGIKNVHYYRSLIAMKNLDGGEALASINRSKRSLASSGQNC